jgi:ribosomal protein L37AE/L43A
LLGHGAVGVVYKAQWKEREKSFWDLNSQKNPNFFFPYKKKQLRQIDGSVDSVNRKRFCAWLFDTPWTSDHMLIQHEIWQCPCCMKFGASGKYGAAPNLPGNMERL